MQQLACTKGRWVVQEATIEQRLWVYALITAALLQPSMDKATCTRTKRKFDVAYMIAKENLPFTRMKAMCELEERHGAELGQGYKNDQACATFV